MTRRSPYRHPVRSYLREGTRVDRYMRGDGDKPKTQRHVIGVEKPNYRVTVDGRVYPVEAGDVLQALDRALARHGAEATRVTVRNA